MAAAEAIFESAIEAEKVKEASKILPFLLLQYARFLLSVSETLGRTLQGSEE